MKAKSETRPKERKFPKVATSVKAGPNRRPHDHIGNFNFSGDIIIGGSI